MRLTQFRVRDYRSVHDSGVILVEPDKTLLVGVNEAGKTALLRALQQMKAPRDTEGFSALRDYPRSRYTEVQRGEKDPSEICVVEAKFSLDGTERQLVREESPTSTDVSELVIYRYLDNTLQWNFGSARLHSKLSDITKDLAQLRAYLARQDDGTNVVAELDRLLADRREHAAVNGDFAKALLVWLGTAFPLVGETDEREERR